MTLIVTTLVCAAVAGCGPQDPNSGVDDVAQADPHAGHNHPPGEGHGDEKDPHAGHDHGPGEGHDDEKKPTEPAKAGSADGLAPGKGPWQQLPAASYKKSHTGLVHAVIKEGKGEGIKPGRTAVMHYTGWLQSNGEKFDSSRDRSEPFSFPLGAGAVIKGWDEGVEGMKVGEMRQLVIPAALGYGPMGSGPIPGNATLVFDVQLMEIQ